LIKNFLNLGGKDGLFFALVFGVAGLDAMCRQFVSWVDRWLRYLRRRCGV